MNILLINHYAGSPKHGMEYRPYYLSKKWIDQGHNVSIISASHSHVRQQQPNTKGQSWYNEKIDGIDYHWVKTNAYSGNGLGRILNILSFVLKLFINKQKISKLIKPDVVIASSTYPLDNYPARSIARMNKAKYIYEVHDIWPLSPIELGGFSKWHPYIMLLQASECYAYKYADQVVSMLPKAAEHMISKGLDPAKFHYIPNGVELQEWEQKQVTPDSHLQLINKLKKENKQLIAYTGSLGLANSIETLLEAAKILQSNHELCFLIIGGGPEKENLKKISQSYDLNNVYFLDPVPKKCIPDLLSHFDILYIGLQKQSLFRFGISPNKLIDYMMASKPIIQAINAGNDMVGDAKCGISVEAENPQAICEAVLKLSQKSPQQKADIGLNGHKFVLSHHEYSILADRFLKIMKFKP
ncbi:MAG: glycosyltransferase family 4 protein [Bacteroidales bacterium]|nr:glycosyltransferase family 4 protein [Bacteroidales bacterium]